MQSKSERKIPASAVPRLSRYYRALLESRDKDVISSEEISSLTGFTAAQVRKDLTYFGQFGTPGRGYSVQELRKALIQILGIDRVWNVVLLGVGKLGAALLGYKGFRLQGFRLVSAFDVDAAKVGSQVEGVPIHPLEHIQEVVKKENVQMGIVAVPQEKAQAATDLLVAAGVRSILNFAPIRLKVPEEVMIHHVDMASELEKLSFLSVWKNGRKI